MKITKVLITIFIFLMLIMPVLSFAQPFNGACPAGTVAGANGCVPAANSGGGLVPPCGVDSVTGQCTWGFKEFLTLISNVIHFLLFDLALPIAAVMFFYAGFLLVTAGGAEAKTKAKHIFTNAVIGLVIAAAAWLIITTILTILGYSGASFF